MGAGVALQCHAQQAAGDRGCAHELARQGTTLPQGLEGLPLGLLLRRKLRGGLGRGDGDEGGVYTVPSHADFGPASLTYPLPTPSSGGGPSDLHQDPGRTTAPAGDIQD